MFNACHLSNEKGEVILEKKISQGHIFESQKIKFSVTYHLIGLFWYVLSVWYLSSLNKFRGVYSSVYYPSEGGE